MENSESTSTELIEALTIRKIWQKALKQENYKIKSVLQENFFKYFLEIKEHIMSYAIVGGYEFESSISIADVIIDKQEEVIAEISFYWVSTDQDIDDFEVIPAKFTDIQKSFVCPIILKFQDEMKIKAKIVYE